MTYTPPVKEMQVECYVCGTVFTHDANYDDAWCTSCGELIEIN